MYEILKQLLKKYVWWYEYLNVERQKQKKRLKTKLYINTHHITLLSSLLEPIVYLLYNSFFYLIFTHLYVYIKKAPKKAL